MAENMRESIDLIRSMESESIRGPMVEDIMVTGKIAKDMGLVKLFISMVAKNMEYGSTISE